MASSAEAETGPFPEKLKLVLKALSLSRGALAAEIGLDKSVVGKWVAGKVTPSPNNLARLSRLVALRVEGFSVLDWDRPIADLAALFGAPVNAATPDAAGANLDSLPFSLLDQGRDTAARRGAAYEGFFRTLRPYAQHPGRFLHDYVRLRKADNGQLTFTMASGGVIVEGWAVLLQNQIFVVGTEMTSGAFAYAILNGVNTVQAGRLDDLILYCALDATRTPTASPILLTRIGDLTGDATRRGTTPPSPTWRPGARRRRRRICRTT